MKSKLIAACMALAAFAAIVLPASASASPVLTENGVKVAVGASITALNEPGINTVFTGPFNVSCNYTHLVGTVTENSGTSIKGKIPVGGSTFKGTAASEDCTSALGAVKPTVQSELCLATTKINDQLEVTGCGKNVTFSLAITGSVTCKYEASQVLASFTTAPSEATVLVSKQPASGEATNSFICPSTGELDMPFNLFTADGKTGLTIS
jgi:hypothetical protein